MNLPLRHWFVDLLVAYEYSVIVYLFVLSTIYFILVLVGFFEMIRHRFTRRDAEENSVLEASALVPPVSILAPACNQEAAIRESVRALLMLSYPQFEVIVINDGSKDRTLKLLIEEFHLYRSARYYENTLPAKPVRAVYESMDPVPLVVVDKENGGKADALNAGINVARYPLVCAVDADSLLESRCPAARGAAVPGRPQTGAGRGRHRARRQRMHRGGRARARGRSAALLDRALSGGRVSPFLPGRARGLQRVQLPAGHLGGIRAVFESGRPGGGRVPHLHGGRRHGAHRPAAPLGAQPGERLPDRLPARPGLLDRGPRVARDPQAPAQPVAAGHAETFWLHRSMFGRRGIRPSRTVRIPVFRAVRGAGSGGRGHADMS